MPLSPSPPRFTAFVVGLAVGATVAMGLFPPFTSLSGVEYAFVLVGPAWSRSLGPVGADLGLEAHLHWSLLLIQWAAVWALALGAKWLVPPPKQFYGVW
jgi:hypothetical protein